MIKLGLIGYPLGHSFSKNFYLSKFEAEGINHIDYDLYPIEHIEKFIPLLQKEIAFRGFNVTIPYKQTVMDYVDDLSQEAAAIQAVNCITIHRTTDKLWLKGYNTDAYGFQKSLEPLLKPQHTSALVLGNGGAAKAVFYVLQKLHIPYHIVSRSKDNGDFTYHDLTADIIESNTLIINCSPVGTYPNIAECPEIPYEALSSQHLLYDLIYNPEETLFLKKGKEKGATIKNGYEMLVLQAEKNWEIWQSNF